MYIAVNYNVYEYEFLKIIDMIKILITDYKKIRCYGDMHLHENGYTQYFIGQVIKVKILGLFWVDYKRIKFLNYYL